MPWVTVKPRPSSNFAVFLFKLDEVSRLIYWISFATLRRRVGPGMFRHGAIETMSSMIKVIKTRLY